MPRIVEYPHASFKQSLELATAVDYLGGSCTINSCAERLNKKISGAFRSLIGAAIKHGLVTSKKEILSTTELFRLHKLAYNEDEKLGTMRKSFLFPLLYKKIYERFKGKELPISMLAKLLIREFGVEENYASRISGYFIDGAKSLNMLDNGRLIDDVSILNGGEEIAEEEESKTSSQETIKQNEKFSEKDVLTKSVALPQLSNSNVFTVMIVGPGMNTTIEINEEDDLFILDAMIKKIKKKLKEGSE